METKYFAAFIFREIAPFVYLTCYQWAEVETNLFSKHKLSSEILFMFVIQEALRLVVAQGHKV